MSAQISSNVKRVMREVLDGADVFRAEYSTGRAIKRRGWADEIGSRHGEEQGRYPIMTLRLTENGREAAHAFREEKVYRDTYDSTTKDLPNMIDAGLNPFDAAAEACRLVDRLEAQGMSTAGQRGYRDALQAYCREQVGDERAI